MTEYPAHLRFIGALDRREQNEYARSQRRAENPILLKKGLWPASTGCSPARARLSHDWTSMGCRESLEQGAEALKCGMGTVQGDVTPSAGAKTLFHEAAADEGLHGSECRRGIDVSEACDFSDGRRSVRR